ncbi:hypothetical protein BH11MYX1_BH11MYX1_13310 [soil metagenome]
MTTAPRFLALVMIGAFACGHPGTATTDASSEVVTDATTGVEPGPAYPDRSAYRIKGLQPDFWDPQDVAGNNTGGVSMNLVWASWEPAKKSPPCAAGQEEYDGHCFTVATNIDAAIADYTARGVVVTAVVYGVPAWAHTTRPCTPVSSGYEIFCAPDHGADYGRYAGMLARRYDGSHGHGRIADFVIHNEVNSNDWFDIGCGQGTPCPVGAWLDIYAESYNAAYDAVKSEVASDKVLVSLEHHFAQSLDAPAAASPVLSVQTFLTCLAARLGNRSWRVAYHPYATDLLAPTFSPDDLPYVTYGNIGVIAGWLRKTFPATPSAWQLQLTESGVNSLATRSTEAAQADRVCDTLRNVLGTPGIESYIYHRMRDNPVETAGGLGLGLRRIDGSAKPAWARWALANRNDLMPPQLACGFEVLPYIRITRSNKAGRGHWASSRLAPPGFVTEQSFRVLHDAATGTRLLYECAVGAHDLVTTDVGCEGQQPLGPIGYAWTAAGAGRVALYRCRVGNGTDHFISTDAACEGATVDTMLGYVLPGA